MLLNSICQLWLNLIILLKVALHRSLIFSRSIDDIKHIFGSDMLILRHLWFEKVCRAATFYLYLQIITLALLL